MVERIMTLSEYARHKSVELKAVKRAIEEGRLPPEVIKKGSNNRKLIYVESADKCWDENTIINNKNEFRQKSLNLGDETPGRRGPEPIDPAEKVGSKLNNYRTATEGYKAQLYRLEYFEKARKLCKADDVRRVASELAGTVKNALENLPDKIAPLMVGHSEQGKPHSILVKEIEAVLQNLSRGNFDFLKREEDE